jgi:hypothetical protein
LLALQWVAYRTAVGCSFVDMIGALIASHALSVASVRAMCNERIPWVRTSKFKALLAERELRSGAPHADARTSALTLAGDEPRPAQVKAPEARCDGPTSSWADVERC